MRPRNLECKVALLDAHPAVVLAHAAFQFIDADDRVVVERTNWCGLDGDTIEDGPEFIARSFAGGCRVNLSSAVVRRNVVAGLAFAEEEGTAADMGVWLRIALRGSVGYIDSPLTAVRRHPDSDSVRSGAYRLETASYRRRGDAAVVAGRLVKNRFLDAHGSELDDLAKHRRLARAWSCVELLRPIDQEVKAGAAISTTVRGIARGAAPSLACSSRRRRRGSSAPRFGSARRAHLVRPHSVRRSRELRPTSAARAEDAEARTRRCSSISVRCRSPTPS